jgi:hypothetical protein
MGKWILEASVGIEEKALAPTLSLALHRLYIKNENLR